MQITTYKFFIFIYLYQFKTFPNLCKGSICSRKNNWTVLITMSRSCRLTLHNLTDVYSKTFPYFAFKYNKVCIRARKNNWTEWVTLIRSCRLTLHNLLMSTQNCFSFLHSNITKYEYVNGERKNNWTVLVTFRHSCRLTLHNLLMSTQNCFSFWIQIYKVWIRERRTKK